MKKQNYYGITHLQKGANTIRLALPIKVQAVTSGEEDAPVDIDVADIKKMCVLLVLPDVTGARKLKLVESEDVTGYMLDGSQVVVNIKNTELPFGCKVRLTGMYGDTNLFAVMQAFMDGQGTEHVFDDYVLREVSTGGGGDYKTDVYMDGDGRVIVERLEDGSTMLLDEHENPILKRNADGSTQYFDAYQSARLLISANGEVEVSYTEDETVKTLAVAEAILARTQKRLLYNTAGETTIKDAEGNVLTHADIYAMLMTSPDFVVLVRSDHAFHPNLVTPTQIAFTCSYLGADRQISAERVNITSENVVTYTNGKGVTFESNTSINYGDSTSRGGQYSFCSGIASTASGKASFVNGRVCNATSECAHAEGANSTASGAYSHSEGNGGKSIGAASHAEGVSSTANGENSHSEGTNCTTNAGTSHAEGNRCQTGTNGGSAHAEGSYTNANGAASHAEGYRTTTTEGGQHAQGCWNKPEGGQYTFMHGCGTSAEDLCNAFLIAGDQVYMRGVGDYDGTNYGAEGVKSVQTVIRELQLKLINF